MMDRKPKRELIRGIKDFLKDFEEPYDHREWKNFQRHRRRKQRKPIPLVVKLTGIAASLFLMVYASVRFLPFFDEPAVETVKQVPGPNPIPNRPVPLRETEPWEEGIPTSPSKNEAFDRVTQGYTKTDSIMEVITPDSVSVFRANYAALGFDSVRIERSINKIELQNIPFAGALDGHSRPLHSNPNKPLVDSLPNLRPWVGNRLNLGDVRIGVNINPVFAAKGFSVGGGLSAQIPLSSRLSAEIGASYSNMTVGTDLDIEVPSMEGDYMVGTRNAVGMVAIPVALNYSVTEHFSASLGLVPFRVVRDYRTDILQSYRWVRGDLSSGDTTRRLISERNEMKRPDSLYKNNSYLGFIQLSGHISPPFLSRYNTVIAPYIGIPVGGLRDDRYRWLHGGVSLRVYLR
ncbi:hypothetical protein [Parapedobacter koreensis]|nr:hypothetical protein [Parapedobacter koreensis]